MMTLYQCEGCPYCRMVRQKLSDLELTYVAVCVPRDRSRRQQVVAAYGQPTVRVLEDGDVVLSDDREIVACLENSYGKDPARPQPGPARAGQRT